jgi:hypothetical protein
MTLQQMQQLCLHIDANTKHKKVLVEQDDPATNCLELESYSQQKEAVIPDLILRDQILPHRSVNTRWNLKTNR